MAVFLWRYAGSPSTSGTTGFTDIPTGAYYENAVTWLVGEGITTGTSPGHFSPNQSVTRAQMAVFLWRSACGNTPISIASGDTHTCALEQNGRMACWGDNFSGQLGDGTTTNRATPTLVPGLTNITAITAGGAHTCALNQNGTVACLSLIHISEPTRPY